MNNKLTEVTRVDSSNSTNSSYLPSQDRTKVLTGILPDITVVYLDTNTDSFYLSLQDRDKMSLPILVKLYKFGGIELVSLDTLVNVNAITVCTLKRVSPSYAFMLICSDKDANYVCDLKNSQLKMESVSDKLSRLSQIISKNGLELSAITNKWCGRSTVIIKGSPTMDYVFKKSTFLTTGYIHEYTSVNGSSLYVTNMNSFIKEKEKEGYNSLKDTYSNRFDLGENGNIHFLRLDDETSEVINIEEDKVISQV